MARVPRIPRVSAPGATTALGAGARSAFAAGSRGFQRLADSAEAELQRQQTLETARQVNAGVLAATSAFNSLNESFAGDQDFSTRMGRYSVEGEAALAEIVAGVPDPRARDAVSFKANQLFQADLVNQQAITRSQQNDALGANFIAGTAEYAQQAAFGTPQQVDLAIANFDASQQMMIGTGAHTREEAATNRLTFFSDIDQFKAEEMTRLNPDAAAAFLLPNSGQFGNLDPLKREALLEQAETLVAKIEREEEAAAAAQLTAVGDEVFKDAIITLETPGGIYTLRDLELDAPDMTPTQVTAVVRAMQDETVTTDPDIEVRLTARAMDSTEDQGEILNDISLAYIEKDISRDSWNSLRAVTATTHSEDFPAALLNAEANINKLLPSLTEDLFTLEQRTSAQEANRTQVLTRQGLRAWYLSEVEAGREPSTADLTAQVNERVSIARSGINVTIRSGLDLPAGITEPITRQNFNVNNLNVAIGNYQKNIDSGAWTSDIISQQNAILAAWIRLIEQETGETFAPEFLQALETQTPETPTTEAQPTP